MKLKPIAIFGVPRSGTSWLGQLFNSSPHVAYRFQPLFSYAFKGRLKEGFSKEESDTFYDDLYDTNDDFILQNTNVSGTKEVSFTKSDLTHLVWKEVRYLHLIEDFLINSDTKIVGIIRHPCGVINSWINAPKEFSPDWDPLEEWRFALKKNKHLKEEFNGYEKWKEVAHLYMRLQEKYPQKFISVVYENLVENTETELKRLFGACDLPLQKQTIDFINKSKNTASSDPYGIMRKAPSVHSWKESLSEEISGAILSDPEFVPIQEYYKWEI